MGCCQDLIEWDCERYKRRPCFAVCVTKLVGTPIVAAHSIANKTTVQGLRAGYYRTDGLQAYNTVLFILLNSPQLLVIHLLPTLFMDKVKVTAKQIDVQFSTEIPVLRFPKAKKCLSECCFPNLTKSDQNRLTKVYFYI